MAFATPTAGTLPTTPIYNSCHFPLMGEYQWSDGVAFHTAKTTNIYLGEPPPSWETLEFRERAFRLMRRAWHRRRGTAGF